MEVKDAWRRDGLWERGTVIPRALKRAGRSFGGHVVNGNRGRLHFEYNTTFSRIAFGTKESSGAGRSLGDASEPLLYKYRA